MDTNKVKYPRTFHIPSSPGKTSDDKSLKDLSCFEGKHVVITEKLDGENTTCYGSGEMHARSVDGRHHESRDWVKANVCPKLYSFNMDFRLCGENMFAKHSIEYNDLESYFYLFSAWSGDTCLNWNYVEMLSEELELPTVPVLWQGMFNEDILSVIVECLDPTKQEGFVIRSSEDFSIADFNTNVAKWVRPGHVTAEDHWMQQQIVKNKLKQ